MSKNLMSLLLITFFLTGCQENVRSVDSPQPVIEQESVASKEKTVVETSNKPVTNELEQSQKTQEKVPSDAEKLTLSLIEKGERALESQRLLTPVDDNANLYFQAALGRDPGNFRAIQGIAAIVDTYTEWAWLAARRGNNRQADRYLESARSVNPGDPVIDDMAARIRDLKAKRVLAAKRARENAAVREQSEADQELQSNVIDPSIEQEETGAASSIDEQNNDIEFGKDGKYRLPKTLFSLSDDEIIAKIQPIIDEVAETGHSLAIYWPNDKEARLIYQIINSRLPEFRVRAMTYHRADYMVEIQQD